MCERIDRYIDRQTDRQTDRHEDINIWHPSPGGEVIILR